MRTIYLTLAIITLSLSATSCRSRQVPQHQPHGVAQQTVIRETAPPRPVVQVSYRQANGQPAAQPTPAQQQPVAEVTLRDLLEGRQAPPSLPPPAPVQATTPALTVTRLAPAGQTNVGITFIESPEPVRQAPAQQAPVNPAFVQHTPIHAPAHQPAVRQENISPLFAADATDLRRYSVVVASLSNRGNAEALQRRLQSEGNHVILAQNERGMFRVIVGSFDNRFQAVAQKEELRRRYSAMGSPDFLVRRYGIPFNDLWILARHF